MKHNVGKMRSYIEIRSPVRVSDGALGYERSDATVCKTWARIVPAGGSEIYQYGHLEQKVSHMVTIRYNAEVSQGNYFVWDGRNFYVEAVIDPNEQKQYLTLVCHEGGPL